MAPSHRARRRARGGPRSRDHALRDEKQELAKLKNDVAERERAVVEDERSLEDQRADAAAGFASEQAKATEQLRNKRDALQVEINDLEEELGQPAGRRRLRGTSRAGTGSSAAGRRP